VLIAALGAPLAVIVNTATYLWSAMRLGRIRSVEQISNDTDLASDTAQLPAATAPRGSQTWRDIVLGLQTVLGHRLVRPLVMSLMITSVAGGFFAALYPLFCLRVLGLSESTFGMIIGVGGVGALGGALLSRPLARAIGVGPTLLVTGGLSVASALCLPLAAVVSSHVAVLACLCGHQLFSDGFMVAFVIQAVTLRQTVLPREVLGRANAAIYLCTMGVLPIAALAAGTVAQLTGVRIAVGVGVACGLIAPLCLWPLRRLHALPTGGELAA
jgi:Na+/melibiose symporter-like transporter